MLTGASAQGRIDKTDVSIAQVNTDGGMQRVFRRAFGRSFDLPETQAIHYQPQHSRYALYDTDQGTGSTKT
jgi:hypothetical protein